MYNITGMNQLVEAINMIHIPNFSYDGITGISTLKTRQKYTRVNCRFRSARRRIFKGGANLAGIIKVESLLTAQQKQDIKTA